MTRPRAARRVQGFALILAVFMLVSLAAIAAYLITVSTGQVAAEAEAEQGALAYQAARTGIEWGAFQVLQNGGGSFASACASAGTASRTLTLQVGLAGYYTEVSCQSPGTEVEGTSTLRSYQLVSTGCNQSPCGSNPGPTYVERQLQLTLIK